MADLPVIKRYDVDEPLDARKKWLEAQIQEKKSRMFATKQEMDKCEQQIDDIRNGKMRMLQYSMIMLTEEVKKLSAEVNQVVIK